MKRKDKSRLKPGVMPDFFSMHVSEARRFYLDLNPSRARPLVVVCGGVEQSTPAYSIQRGTFPFYSLEYVARGEGEVVLNGRRYPLQAGSVFSYGPGVPHRITGSAHHPLIKYFVDFSGRRAAQLLASCGLTAGRISQVFPPQALASLFEEMIEGGIRLGPGHRKKQIADGRSDFRESSAAFSDG